MSLFKRLLGRVGKYDAQIIALNLALLLCLATYYKGVMDERAAWRNKEQIAKTQLELLKRIAAEEVKDVQVIYQERIKTIQTKGATIIKQVPIYVTKHHDAECTIPTNFIRLWNAANQQTDLP